jgi:hypothetical protein
MNANQIMTVVVKSSVKISNVHNRAHNVVLVRNVLELQIIVPFANVQRITSVTQMLSAVPNVTEIAIAHLVGQLVFMAYAKTFAKVPVV